MGQRKAVTQKLATAYRRGSRVGKSRILDELCELTGWHREHARKALRTTGEVRSVKPRPARQPRYSDAVVEALAVCWRVTRYPTGKRLSPMLPVLVRSLRRDGMLTLDDAQATLLCQMSPAPIRKNQSPN